MASSGHNNEWHVSIRKLWLLWSTYCKWWPISPLVMVAYYMWSWGRHDPCTEACFTGTVLTPLVLYKHYESFDTAAGAIVLRTTKWLDHSQFLAVNGCFLNQSWYPVSDMVKFTRKKLQYMRHIIINIS